MSSKFNLLVFALLLTTYSFAQDSSFNNSKSDTIAFYQITQDPAINKLNDLYKKQTKENVIIEGYKIQIYFGSRESAYSSLEKFKEDFPDIESGIIYEEPNFKSVVGSFKTKLEADRVLHNIRTVFSDAFLIKAELDE